MKDRPSVQEHLGKFNYIMRKLAALDMRIEDEEEDSILLYYMLESWNNFIINLSHIENFKMELVISSLLIKEKK